MRYPLINMPKVKHLILSTFNGNNDEYLSAVLFHVATKNTVYSITHNNNYGICLPISIGTIQTAQPIC